MQLDLDSGHPQSQCRGRLPVKVSSANVFDEDVQQHIFGDIISRKVTGQVGFRF